MLKKLFMAALAVSILLVGLASCKTDDDDDDDDDTTTVTETTVKYVGTSGAYFALTGTDVYSSGTWDLLSKDGTSMHSSYLKDCKYTISSETSDVAINSETKSVYTVTFTYVTISTEKEDSQTHYLSSDKSILYYYNSRSSSYSEYTKE